MTVRKACWVECDTCPIDDPMQVPMDLGTPTAAAARAQAKTAGFVRRNGKDICPECQRSLRYTA